MDFYSGKEKTVYLDVGDAFTNKRTTCWGYAAIESYMLQNVAFQQWLPMVKRLIIITSRGRK